MLENTIFVFMPVPTDPSPSDGKQLKYKNVLKDLSALLNGEEDLIASMSIVAAELSRRFDYFFWVGFYRVVDKDHLIIAPYVGTPGCLRIPFGKGVCGAAAQDRRSIVVSDVHIFPGHIACDSRSKSEIVVPVFDRKDELVAVLDVDSDKKDTFDEEDVMGLESITALLKDKRIVL